MIDAAGIFRAAQRTASTLGLTLEQDASCEQPYTDLRTKVVVVPLLSAYTEEHKLSLWLGYVYHEIGHNAPELADMLSYRLAHPIDHTSLFGKVGNVIEDIRNERNRVGYYPGRDTALSKTQSYHALKGAKILGDAKGPLDKDMKLFSEVLGWAYRYRGDTFQPMLSSPSLSFNSHVDSDWLDKFNPDLDKLKTAEDVYELARKIIDESPEHDGEEEEEKAGKGAEGSESGDGESAGKSDGSEIDDGEEGEAVEGEISYEDLLAHDHSDDGGYATKDAKCTIKYDHTRSHDYKVHEINDIQYPEPSHYGPDPDAQRYFDQGSKLASQVRRLFQARSQTLKTYRHKSGRLAKRDLARVLNHEVDVFTKNKNQINLKGTAVFILTDASGSMCGEPYETTAAATALITDALGPVGIPHMIGSFTEHRPALISRVIKGWNERTTPRDVMARYRTDAHELKMNADGESVLWALSELQTRPEERKILIVLSDGQPSATRPGDAWTHTRDAVEFASKYVECYGIGIMDDAVKDFYPEYTVLKRTEELQECLLNVIKTKIVGA